MSVAIETSYLIEHRLGPGAEARFLSQVAGDGFFQVEQLSPDDLRRVAEPVRPHADLTGRHPGGATWQAVNHDDDIRS